MQKASGRRGPAEAIRAVAESYLTFARDNPEVFSLVLEPSGDVAAEDSTYAQNWRFVLDLVGRLYGEKRAPEAATALWAFLHGMTELHKIGAFGKEKPLSSIKFGLQIWIDAAK